MAREEKRAQEAREKETRAQEERREDRKQELSLKSAARKRRDDNARRMR